MDNFVKEKLREWNISSLVDILEGKYFVSVNILCARATYFEKNPQVLTTFTCFTTNSKTTVGTKSLFFYNREHDRPRSFFITERRGFKRNGSCRRAPTKTTKKVARASGKRVELKFAQ